jgi:hypothetical protein
MFGPEIFPKLGITVAVVARGVREGLRMGARLSNDCIYGPEPSTPANYRSLAAREVLSSAATPIVSPVAKETLLSRSLGPWKLVLTAVEHCKSGSCSYSQ